MTDLLLWEVMKKPRPFTPASIAGMEAWFKADALALSDGAAVSSWTDSSIFARPAVQATGGNQPTFQTNELNSLPVIRFDGVNDFLAQAVFGVAVSQPLTFFLVVKSNTPGVRILDGVDGSNRLVLDDQTTTYRFYNGSFASTLACTPTNFNILSFVSNGGSSIARANGGVGGASSGGAQGYKGLNIGCETGSGGGLAGDYAEIIAYDGVLSSSNHNLVGRFLAAKYTLTWVDL